VELKFKHPGSCLTDGSTCYDGTAGEMISVCGTFLLRCFHFRWVVRKADFDNTEGTKIDVNDTAFVPEGYSVQTPYFH
jgi:hypothetical protein